MRRFSQARYGEDVFAVKVLKEDQGNNLFALYQKITSEVACAIPHNNVVRYYAFCTEDYQNYFLIMEYVPRGSLANVLQNDVDVRNNLKLRIHMAREIARGMNMLHSSNPPIVHRDLRSVNILVDRNYSVKVADFGLSVPYWSDSQILHGKCGHIKCIAPEILMKNAYNLASDVYSFGILLWEILSCCEPYKNMTVAEVKQCILRDIIY
jgi:sterile alpha motif and leucine zipper-containing kinase AZK